MLEGYTYPNQIAECTDCARRFCCDCEEGGRCPKCQGVLCSTCHMEAVHERYAICATCAVPRKADDDLAPPPVSDWRYWGEQNARKDKR